MARNDFFSKLLIFSTASNLFLGLSLLAYVMFNDYFLYIMSNIANSGIGVWLSDWPATIIDSFALGFNVLPSVIDKLWAVSFIMMVSGIVIEAYKSKRRGYFELVSLLSFGVMVFLFVFAIWNQVSTYLYNVFINGILRNLVAQLPLFNLYIANLTFINLLIVIVAILINVIDLDFSKFNSRKDREIISDEL